MKSVKHPLLILFVCCVQPLLAQYFEFQWSDKLDYANNKEGFFSGVVGTNSQYIYTLNHNYAVSPLRQNKQLKLISYDKLKLSEAAAVPLKGYPENSGTAKFFDELEYHQTVVLEDWVLIFWVKTIDTDSTQTEEIYVQSYKHGLAPGQQIRQIYTITQRTDGPVVPLPRASLVIAGNQEADRVIVGSEIQEAGKLVFRYLVLESKLTASAEHVLTLPVGNPVSQNGIAADYEYGRDGNLYIRKQVPLSNEERDLETLNKAKSYLRLTVVHPASGKQTTLAVRGANKTITDFSYLITGKKTKVYGFFGDLEKDPSGIDKQGIFYTEIDSETLADAALNYAYFEKTTLNRLFPKSKGGRKRNKEADELAREEALLTRFDIEQLFEMENGDVVLFFTRKYNYTEITSKSGFDGKNVYKTDLYCEKNNISAIRITTEGKILWTSNVERTITYTGTDIADLQVIYKLNKFYVIAGSENPEAVPKKRAKKESTYKEQLEYASFDPLSGKAKKFVLEVNEEDVLPKNRRSVDPKSIRVYDGNYYFHKSVMRQKPIWYVANVLFFPSIYYAVLSGNTKHATGDLGVLTLKDGKPERRKKAPKSRKK